MEEREQDDTIPAERGASGSVGLLDRLRRSRSVIPWEGRPGGFIWRLQPTTDGVLVGEARDVRQKQLSLFGIRPATGDLLWSGRTFDEPWWIALETTIGNVAVLHRYPRPDRPETLGCIAVDAFTGSVLWEDPTGRILFGDGSTALLQRGAPTDWNDVAIVSLRDGTEQRSIGGQMEEVLDYQEACGDQERWNGWTSATIVPSDSDDWGRTLAEFQVPVDRPIVGDIETVTYDEWRVLAVHAASPSDPSNIVTSLYLRRGGRNLLRQQLHSGPPGSSGDTFFIWRGVLMAIREGDTIIGIDLNS